MEKVILVVLCGVLDRIRGMPTPLKSWMESSVYGLVVSLFFISPSYLTVSFVVLFWMGTTVGWGHPINKGLGWHKDKFEWWQLGDVLKNNWVLALVVRGLIWGVPLLVLLPYITNIYMVAISYAIAMPLAVYLARIQNVYTKDKWAVQEILRGLLAGMIILISVYFM